MNEHIRIAVPLSQAEFMALRNLAMNEYRHPREQARYLLRSILLNAQNDNVSADRQVKSADIVSTNLHVA